MQRQRLSVSSSRAGRQALMLAWCVLVPAIAAASNHRIDYMVQAWAAGADTLTYSGTEQSETSLWEEVFVQGVPDDTGLTPSGWASARAGLAKGSLHAFTLANNARGYHCMWDGTCVWDWEYGGRTSVAEAGISMADDLYFTVPAGTYAEALTVSFLGHADYYLSASGYYGARGDFVVRLDPPYASVQRFWGPVGDQVIVGSVPPGAGALFNGQIGDAYPFELGAVLLPAGTTLSQPLEIGLRLHLGLGQGKTLLAGPLTTLEPIYSYGDSRFDLVIDQIRLPAGVTFTSSSGVYLSEVAVVPEPAAWLLMSVGLGLIGWTVRRHRQPIDAGAVGSQR